MTVPDRYLEKIQAVYPQLCLDHLELNQDGMNNDVVIVNQQLVCRFTKTDWAKDDLKQEIKVLQLIQQFVDLPTPRFDQVEDDFVSYALIQGEPLSRNQLLRLDSRTQENVIEQLGQFLQQLYSIPDDAIESANISNSPANRSREDLIHLYEQVQQILFPLLWKHQQVWVHEHFQPVVSGSLSLDAPDRLVHGDLGCYHLLFDSDRQQLSGIIDFGTAGIGNPAIDLAALLDTHGEAILKRLSKHYPNMEALLDQARFRAGVVWLQWALMGVQHSDTGLLLAHIGSSARDIGAIGAAW